MYLIGRRKRKSAVFSLHVYILYGVITGDERSVSRLKGGEKKKRITGNREPRSESGRTCFIASSGGKQRRRNFISKKNNSQLEQKHVFGFGSMSLRTLN